MNSGTRILLIIDSDKDRAILSKELQDFCPGSRIDVIDSYENLKENYKLNYYDVIICDFELSNYKGVEVLFYVRERELHVPFIFVSDLQWEDATVDTLVLNGASDYVMKNNLKQLRFVIRREVNRTRHILNTEQKLKRSEFRFRSIVQTIHGIVREVDLSTHRNMYVSPQSINILGYPASDWKENHYFWIEQMHPKDREIALATVKKAMNEGGNQTVEYRMINADGDIVWIRDLLTVRETEHRSLYLNSLMIDITEKKTVEIQRDHALENERRRLKEQKCLWNITNLDEQEFSIPQLFQRAMMNIPVGFRYPEKTGVSIRYDGEQYQTSNYEESDLKLVSENKKIRNGPLSVEVGYLDESLAENGETFLKEERHLLDTILDILYIKISKKLTSDDLKKHEQLLINTYELAQLGRSI